MYVWSDDRYAPSEVAYCCKEVAEQDEYSVQFDKKANHRPAEEDKNNTARECSGTFELRSSCEEEHCLLQTDHECKAADEEDLAKVSEPLGRFECQLQTLPMASLRDCQYQVFSTKIDRGKKG